MNDENLGAANAWRAFDTWFNKHVKSRQNKIHEEVTSKLFKDGCHSAWVHQVYVQVYVIEALMDRIEELEDEIKNG